MFDYFNYFWKWSGESPDKVTPTGTAIYFYILHVANSLNWRDSFSLSSTQIMNGCGIANYKTYKKHFDELVENGFVKIVKQSTNQYSANIIALVKNTEAHTTALPKHIPEQDSSTYQSTAHIHKTIKTVKTEKTIKTKGADLNKVYSENEAVNKHFIEFLRNRIEIKKPATQRAADLLVYEMRKLYKTPDEAIQGINQSIMKGWTGLFPIGSQNHKQVQPQPTQFNRSSANHYV